MSPSFVMRLVIVVAFAIIILSSFTPYGKAHETLTPASNWIEAGSGGILPAEAYYDNPLGKLGVLNASGPVDMKDHAFFEPLGLNPRGCVTCHQPSSAMSVSADALRERWRVTKGEDPVFAAVDGSNNPKLAQALESSHTLLLNRGVFRIGLPWPPRSATGKAIQPEFTIEVVRDPTGVNLDDTYGLTGVNPTISVFRRPRPSANLKYSATPDVVNLMTDARHANLQRQAFGAYKDHQEGRQGQLSREEFEKIIGYETQVFVAQVVDRSGANLVSRSGPGGIGPRALAEAAFRVITDTSRAPVFRPFDAWRMSETKSGDLTEEQRQFRASVARGSDIFTSREFAITDVANFNPSRSDVSARRSCSSCHSVEMTGQHPAPGWMDIGISTYRESSLPIQSELPVFKCTCREDATPHPYLGRVIYTSDPGRALITGKCADIGSIVVAPLRGLAARDPYFSNGSAKTLRDVVEFLDRRFNIRLTEEEKRDLVNFLSVL